MPEQCEQVQALLKTISKLVDRLELILIALEHRYGAEDVNETLAQIDSVQPKADKT